MKVKRREHNVPKLQMASMPDLIFTVLFFFMIVTHIRENPLHVQYKTPVGTSLQKVKNNPAVIYVYVGKDIKTSEYQVQVNNKIVPLENLVDVFREERQHVSSDNMENLCTSLHADRYAPMAVINKVKMALREASVLKINYSGTNDKP